MKVILYLMLILLTISTLVSIVCKVAATQHNLAFTIWGFERQLL